MKKQFVLTTAMLLSVGLSRLELRDFDMRFGKRGFNLNEHAARMWATNEELPWSRIVTVLLSPERQEACDATIATMYQVFLNKCRLASKEYNAERKQCDSPVVLKEAWKNYQRLLTAEWSTFAISRVTVWTYHLLAD